MKEVYMLTGIFTATGKRWPISLWATKPLAKKARNRREKLRDKHEYEIVPWTIRDEE